MTFHYVILEKRSYTGKDTQLHTLISYVLLLKGITPFHYKQIRSAVVRAPGSGMQGAPTEGNLVEGVAFLGFII